MASQPVAVCKHDFDVGAAGHSVLRHEDCVLVHKTLLDAPFEARTAQQWWLECQQHFEWSAYFQGSKAAPLPANGVANDLEKLQL